VSFDANWLGRHRFTMGIAPELLNGVSWMLAQIRSFQARVRKHREVGHACGD
jgi:hypothetical protein